MKKIHPVTPLAVCAALALAMNAQAQTTITWANAGTDFEADANWSGGVAPADDLIGNIGTFSGTPTFLPSLSASRSIAGLRFSSGDWTLSRAGTTEVLTIGSQGIGTSAGTTTTISAPIRLGANQEWAVDGFLSLTGQLVNNSMELNKTGAGTLSLRLATTNAGGAVRVTVSGGVLEVPVDLARLSGNGGSITLNGGTFRMNSNANTTSTMGSGRFSAFAMGPAGGTVDVVTSSATLLVNRGITTVDGGPGSLTKVGAGALTLSAFADNGTTAITHNQLGMHINEGTVRFSHIGAFNRSGEGQTITFNGGALELTGANVVEFTAERFGGGLETRAGGATFNISNSAGRLNIEAPISGAGALTKSGSGTLALLGANSHQGATNVNNGVLVVGHNNALGATNAAVNTVASNASLQFSHATGLNIGAESFQISGAGTGGLGNLRSVSGHNVVGGLISGSTFSAITLAANASIGVDADSLTYRGNITGSHTLTKVGAGAFIAERQISVSALALNAGTFGLGQAAGESFGFVQAGSISIDDGVVFSLVSSDWAFAGGQVFHLFRGADGSSAPSISGTFASLDLPTLSGGLSWDSSQLYSAGTLQVIPEPAAFGVFAGLFGLGAAALRRRGRTSKAAA